MHRRRELVYVVTGLALGPRGRYKDQSATDDRSRADGGSVCCAFWVTAIGPPPAFPWTSGIRPYSNRQWPARIEIESALKVRFQSLPIPVVQPNMCEGAMGLSELTVQIDSLPGGFLRFSERVLRTHHARQRASRTNPRRRRKPLHIAGTAMACSYVAMLFACPSSVRLFHRWRPFK